MDVSGKNLKFHFIIMYLDDFDPILNCPFSTQIPLKEIQPPNLSDTMNFFKNLLNDIKEILHIREEECTLTVIVNFLNSLNIQFLRPL